MPAMSLISADAAAQPARYVIDERFARPVLPLAERGKGRKAKKPFVLTSEALCNFIRENTKTPKDTLEFLHDIGCTWDKDGRVTVHPI